MFKYQKIIQGICIAGLIGAFILAVINGATSFFLTFAMFGLLCMIPIGLLQLFGSIIHNLEYGSESKLRTHLKASLITLAILFLGMFTSYLNINVLGVILGSAAMLSSIVLMIYYWVIIFQKEEKGSII